MSGLRFCMVTTFYPPYNLGGDGVAIRQLSQALVRRGHGVTVVHDVDAYNMLSGGAEPPFTQEPDDGVKRVEIRSGVGAISPLLTQQTGRPLATGRKIRRLLDAERFDVINFHNASLIGGPGILSAGHGAVKLYMAHEYWLVCPTHNLWRHRREACPGRECLRCTLSYRRPPQLWRYTGYLERQLAHVDTFIAPSEVCREKHREFGFSREMEVVPNFLPDPTGQEPTAGESSPHERPYFLFVGRLALIKGLEDVISTFGEYEDADLLIAGAGDHLPVLEDLARGNARVRFLGHVRSEDLGRLYRHALAVLLPTVSFETFGLTMLEAFRESTPVIARRCGAPVEILERSGGGELFEGAGGLLAAMRRIEGDPELRRRLGRAGYEAYVDHWSESEVMPLYLDVVRRAAEARGIAAVAAALA